MGGGFTGLWTAYYLKRADPGLDITVFEAQVAGFGASGRNGGWCIGSAWGVHDLLRHPETRSRGLALQRALFDTVDEIGGVADREGIDCHFTRGGSLRIASAAFHADLQRHELEALYRLGFTDHDYRWLEPDESRQRIRSSANHGALWFSHCAAIQPARLVRGLADVVRRQGVRLLEGTPVARIEAGAVHTATGMTRATHVLRATEAYTDSLAGASRQLMPVYSLMVATEPMSRETWAGIGLAGRETFGDDRRMVVYGQRTADGRLAFGARAGYRFRSRWEPVVSREDPRLTTVGSILRTMLPQLADVQLTHGWGGVLGVPRHWRPCVSYAPETGLGWAGGYIGEGVAASNLAARILADLVLSRRTALTELPWVNDLPPRWMPEPVRWLGAQLVQRAGERADRTELTRDRPSRFWGNLFRVLTG